MNLSPIKVTWLKHPLLKGRLGLTMCPGRTDLMRDLDRDLSDLRGHLLCLLPQSELSHAGVPDLIRRARVAGLTVRHHPIADFSVPDPVQLAETLDWLSGGLATGQPVVIHCMAGLGRAGVVAACLLIERGLSADDAIALIRAQRDPGAVETAEQEQYCVRWADRVRGPSPV